MSILESPFSNPVTDGIRRMVPTQNRIRCERRRCQWLGTRHSHVKRSSASDRSTMEVLRSTPLSDKAAAKLLKKFVDTKEGEENADLVVRRASFCGLSCGGGERLTD
jgi:hypothetical protein